MPINIYVNNHQGTQKIRAASVIDTATSNKKAGELMYFPIAETVSQGSKMSWLLYFAQSTTSICFIESVIAGQIVCWVMFYFIDTFGSFSWEKQREFSVSPSLFLMSRYSFFLFWCRFWYLVFMLSQYWVLVQYQCFKNILYISLSSFNSCILLTLCKCYIMDVLEVTQATCCLWILATLQK